MLLQVLPAPALHDATNLGNRHAQFVSDSALRPSRAIRHAFTDIQNLGLGQFRSATFPAILHRAVTAHVHLVFAVGRPAQVVNAVVGWVSIVVGYVGLPFHGRWKVGHSDQPVRSYNFPLSSVRNEGRPAVAKLVGSRMHGDRRVSLGSARVPPFANFPAPASDFAKFGRFVQGEAWDWFPHGGGSL